MNKQGKRILSLILSFTIIISGLNHFAFATEKNKDGADLSFACEGYAEPELGGDIPSLLQLTTEDKNVDLSSAGVTMQWIKNEDSVWAKADEEQFGEGEYRIALRAQSAATGEYEFPEDQQTISVNGETFEYAEGEGLESGWQVAENKDSFTVYSKVYKLNGVEYWTNIFTQAGAYEYAAALDLETAIDYNNDPEFAGKTDEERIEVVKGWLAAAEEEEPVVLAGDPEIYYGLADETDGGGNAIKVLHISSTPFDANGENSITPFDFGDYGIVNKIVIDNVISPTDSHNFKFIRYSKVTSIENLDLVNTTNMTDFSHMFDGCSKLTSLDVSSFDTSKATDMSSMFAGASNLADITGIEDFDVKNVKTMDYMFSNTIIKKLDLSKYNTQNLENTSSMFQTCNKLEEIKFGTFNTQNIKDMSRMFWRCYKLKKVDLENFDTGSVTNMNSMFRACTSLEELDLSNFNTSSVTDMSDMFNMTKVFASDPVAQLKKLNLSSFDTSNVIKMYSMFANCVNLETLDISGFEINDVVSKDNFFLNDNALSKIESPKNIADSVSVMLPKIMVNEEDRTQTFGNLPKSPDFSQSITLIPYDTALLLDGSEYTLLFKKYFDDELVNDAERFEFGVFKEDGTDTGIRVKNEAEGTIVLDAENLPEGRYYIQEIRGSEHILYDNVKYYFSVVEETYSVETTYPSMETVFIPLDEDYLDLDKYDLIANVHTIIAYEKGTSNPVKTFRAYCADKSKIPTNGQIADAPDSVYVNPTEAQINAVRGVVYNGPNKGDLSDAIKCILLGDQEKVQGTLWGLLNYNEEIDTSGAGTLPTNFKWAIVKAPNVSQQPLIVPIWTTEAKENIENVGSETFTKKAVRLETTDIEFRNMTLDQNIQYLDLTATKTLNGATLEASQFTFELKDSDGNVLQTKKNAKNGDVIFDLIDYDADDFGKSFTYTVSEKNTGESGMVYDYTVYTVKVAIDDEGNLTRNIYKQGEIVGGALGGAVTGLEEVENIIFENSYSPDKGNLVITKTLKGDVTAEEAEGVLKFKVTGPDGTATEYTLDKFTKGQDGKYTLTLENVVVGEYTVEETTKDITGKTVTVKYTVNAGEETTGDKATAGVTKGATSTVDFENNYVNDKGNLVITKTLKGDVTAEEAEGVLKFKVTGPDGTATEYTLDKFTKGQDGKYTLTLENVVVGEYTVEETTKDITGKTVTVKYTVNAGEETTGDKATAGVTKGATSTVDFENNYVNDKPKDEKTDGEKPDEQNETPDTGDATPIMIWKLLMLTSAAVVTAMGHKAKKSK